MPKSKKNAREPVTQPQGISNRETPEEEAEEREAFPPVQTSSPSPQDVSGRVGEQPLDDMRDRHTSHKAGSRSIAQKESESKYADRGHPASHKVEGAFGREPRRRDDEAEDQANDGSARDQDS
jgi:hypothetical protein